MKVSAKSGKASKPAPAQFSRILKNFGAWFERQKRVLPWRDEPTLYRVWVSEIMLQQTQVITVVPYFERFIERFPTVQALAQATEAEVTAQWAGLGYYSRARNLRKGAQMIVGQGDFPRTREGWLEIPGVGHYTAGAVLSIALDQCEAILDGNVERVLSRVHRVDRDQGDTEFKQKLWSLSAHYVAEASCNLVRPSVLNQALMELGATICTPKKPKCALCPLATMCESQIHSVQELYPPRKKPKEWIEHEETLLCFIDDRGRVLLRKREKGEWRAGLWDLVEEKPKGLLAKKIAIIETKHVVTRHKITRTTEIYQVKSKGSRIPKSLKWVASEDLSELGAGSALVKTLQKVSQVLEEAASSFEFS